MASGRLRAPLWGESLRRRQGRFCACGCLLCVVLGAASTFAFPLDPGPAGPRDASLVSARAEPESSSPSSGSSTTVAIATPERSQAVQVWGVLGVAAYLSYGLKKVVPIVREGIGMITAPWQWLLLAGTLGFFAYIEGYKGFQLGFCPRVVSRAWAVSEKFPGVSTRDLLKRSTIFHKLLAPAFCIGYFHGTRTRVISSWSVTTIIFLVVFFVRKLANPYRAIIDAGVIVGLLWGTVSVLILFAKSLRAGKPPDFDPCLPSDTPYHPA